MPLVCVASKSPPIDSRSRNMFAPSFGISEDPQRNDGRILGRVTGSQPQAYIPNVVKVRQNALEMAITVGPSCFVSQRMACQGPNAGVPLLPRRIQAYVVLWMCGRYIEASQGSRVGSVCGTFLIVEYCW